MLQVENFTEDQETKMFDFNLTYTLVCAILITVFGELILYYFYEFLKAYKNDIYINMFNFSPVLFWGGLFGISIWQYIKTRRAIKNDYLLWRKKK
jgi:hypothetical protein